MYSELIVMILDNQESWDDAWQFVEAENNVQKFRLIDIALIYQDSGGNVMHQARFKENSHLNDSSKCMACLFAEVLFEESRIVERQQLVEAGLDPFFLQNTSESFQPNSLVYLMHISRESLIDSRPILDILREQQGNLNHTTFRPEVEAVLREING